MEGDDKGHLAAVGETLYHQTSKNSKFATGRRWRVIVVIGEACCVGQERRAFLVP